MALPEKYAMGDWYINKDDWIDVNEVGDYNLDFLL